MKRKLIALCLLAIGLSFGMTGCTPVVANRGNLIEPDRLERLKVGESRQSDVENILGPPTTRATFNPNIWYYIGQRTEKTAFFKPEIVSSKTLSLQFDESGLLASIDSIDPALAQNIEPAAGKTPTLGRDYGFFEQMLGNAARPGIPGK